MDDVTRIEWLSWGPAAFETARTEHKAVLLSLTATWCEHCHEMDAETYADPAIAAHVSSDFVPIRVDVDRRPRIRDRYNMGGFPTTVFLTPDGEILTGAGYLGIDGMRQVLDSVRERWEEDGADAGRIPRPLRSEEPPRGELTGEVEAHMLAQLRAAYDEQAGGWGDGPKFPLPDALEFALKRDREMAIRSFDAVGANLLDEHEGGFYRFATERDWSGLHHEKLLDANAALVRAFANAYCATGREEYRTPARRTIEYLTTTLWLPDRAAFAGSQAPGNPETYTLEPSDREVAEDPPIDETVFSGANALAVEALLTYYAYTDDEVARRYAERTLETLTESMIDDGRVIHDDGDSITESSLLADQARLLRALTTARSVLGADVLSEATAVAEHTVSELRDGNSFLDGPTGDVGLLDRPLRPLDANVELADGLVDLAVLTGDTRYREIAHDTLADFAGASDRFGVQVAAYGSVASRLCGDPLVVRVGTAAGTDLHRAALRLADHEKIVVPDPDSDAIERGTARIERGETVSERADTPAALSERVGEVLE